MWNPHGAIEHVELHRICTSWFNVKMVQMENTRESKLRTKHGRGSEGEEATWET